MVGMQRVVDEDSLVYKTMRVTVRKGISSAGDYSGLQAKGRMTSIHIANVTRLIAARSDTSPTRNSVSSALSIQQSSSVNPYRWVTEAPLYVPL